MKVLVIGDFMFDKYNYGSSSVVSDEASLPIFDKTSTEWRHGGAANVALNCHHHAQTTLVTALAHNTHFQGLRVPYKIINLLGKKVNTIKERFIIGEKHVFRCDEEAYEVIDIDDVDTEPYDVVLISDYDNGVVHSPEKVIQTARCPVIIDPKGTNWAKYSGAFCLTPNKLEFESVCGALNTDNVREAVKKYRLNAMIVTMASQGLLYVTEDEEIHLPAISKAPVDVTGAGDTFCAMLACYFDVNNIRRSLEIANRAAGIAVEMFGTYAVTQTDLFDHGVLLEINANDLIEPETEKREHGRDDSQKVQTNINEEGRKNFLETRKDKKETLIFTNGCFDIVHFGHVRCLKFAKSLGDKLIVGLNSDASMTRVKRAPIIGQDSRKEMLEGLACVDEVIIFDEDTPYELIKRVKPNILVKGSDYEAKDVVGRELVDRVVIHQRLSRISTTSIMDDIRKRNK